MSMTKDVKQIDIQSSLFVMAYFFDLWFSVFVQLLISTFGSIMYLLHALKCRKVSEIRFVFVPTLLLIISYFFDKQVIEFSAKYREPFFVF